MDVWRPVGLDVSLTRSANEENQSSQESQFLHVLGNTILLFFVSFCCRAALAGRDDTGAGGDGASELPLGEGIHLGGGAPGGEHHGEVGSVGREDLARVVASEGDAGGKTQAFPIKAQC